MKIEERRLRVRDDSSQMSGKYLMVNEWKGKGWFRAPGKGYHKKVYQQVALLTEDWGGGILGVNVERGQYAGPGLNS